MFGLLNIEIITNMKKLLFSVIALFAATSLFGEVIMYTAAAPGTYLLSTNNISVTSVEITSPTTTTVQLFDCASVADPYFGTNYVTSAWVGRQSLATNLVSSYVGYNGYTNWYTNVGIYTITVTNAAATNALPAMGAFGVSANAYATYSFDALFTRGVCATIGATNASVVINYRRNR